ncbi:MAG: hypothetical protein LBO67_03415 [Spirochaetaceae bacterium]|jgi:hypothetical protein|nr:hypothetical protein [Spirochaetaceae bacterium]
MRILFNDVIQNSNAPASLKSAALADRSSFTGQLVIDIDTPALIDAVGIGSTDASAIQVTLEAPDTLKLISGGANSNNAEHSYRGGNAFTYNTLQLYCGNAFDFPASLSTVIPFEENGLYRIDPIIAKRIRITHNGTYIGRFGAGIGVRLGTAVNKEPSFNSTREPRRTLSGQVIPGLGGYSYRSVQLDVRYKIGALAISELSAAYPSQIAAGFPFFILFDDEVRRLPFMRFYAQDTNFSKMSFESGVNYFKFSRKFAFEECF